jgi:hypothetical protein
VPASCPKRTTKFEAVPSTQMPCSADSRTVPAASVMTAATAMAMLLIASGVGYRLLAGEIEIRTSSFLPLRGPLSSIPLRLGPWQGEELPTDEHVLREPGADDACLNRLYVNPSLGTSATVFIGYTGRAHRWLVHRPDICYPAHGQQSVSEEESVLTGTSGERMPCLLYEFHAADAIETNRLVLSTFVVNGRCTNDKHVRNTALFMERAPYIARIQVGMPVSRDTDESSAALRDLMTRLVESLGVILPYFEE